MYIVLFQNYGYDIVEFEDVDRSVSKSTPVLKLNTTLKQKTPLLHKITHLEKTSMTLCIPLSSFSLLKFYDFKKRQFAEQFHAPQPSL